MADQRLLTLGYRPIDQGAYQNMYNGQQGGGAEMQRNGLSPAAAPTSGLPASDPRTEFRSQMHNAYNNMFGTGRYTDSYSNNGSFSAKSSVNQNGMFNPYSRNGQFQTYSENPQELAAQQSAGNSGVNTPAQQQAQAAQQQQAQQELQAQQAQIDPATGQPVQNPMEGHPLSFLQPMGQIMGYTMGQGMFGPNGLFSNGHWSSTQSGEDPQHRLDNPYMSAFSQTTGQGSSQFSPQYGFFKNATMNREPVQTSTFVNGRSSA